jgi:electron transfer flavoprotein beta subunit
MNIIVCVKAVIDKEQIVINERHNVIREGKGMSINHNDLNAIEEGLRLKEQFGGYLTVLSMGVVQVRELLKELLALGADKAILLSDQRFSGADTLATSYALSKGIEKIANYDMILCGKSSSDSCTAHVGPSIAERLKIPHITCVSEIIKINKNNICCRRESDSGYEIIETKMPALITVVKTINEPRYASFFDTIKAANATIPVWSVEDINGDIEQCGIRGSRTKVVKTYPFNKAKDNQIFIAESKENIGKIADKIFNIISYQDEEQT